MKRGINIKIATIVAAMGLGLFNPIVANGEQINIEKKETSNLEYKISERSKVPSKLKKTLKFFGGLATEVGFHEAGHYVGAKLVDTDISFNRDGGYRQHLLF